MDRKYLKTSELGDLTPLCKLPPHILWRFNATDDTYEVELIRSGGRMLVVSGPQSQPHLAVHEALEQWRQLSPEERGEADG